MIDLLFNHFSKQLLKPVTKLWSTKRRKATFDQPIIISPNPKTSFVRSSELTSVEYLLDYLLNKKKKKEIHPLKYEFFLLNENFQL